MYNGPGRKRSRLTVDQICSNVASSQIDQPVTRNESIVPRTHCTISAAHTSTPPLSGAVTSATSSTVTSPAPAPRDSSPHEALNLSISNRTPTTKTTSLTEPPSFSTSSNHQYQHSRITQRDSWPPDTYRALQYRDPQDYHNSRRDSADSPDQPTSSSSKSEDPTDEAIKERRRRQKLSNKDNLYCQVCGDKANGYNFGAITCESCKAFFRRNAQKNKDLKCNFENSCKIDHFTRKFCTACRLNKCFSVNMKKEWILDEDALKKRKKLTRRSMRGDESSSSDYEPSLFSALSTSQMYGASNIPHIAHTSGLFMYMDPALALTTTAIPNSSDYSCEDKERLPDQLSAEEKFEIDRIMDNYALIDSTAVSTNSSTSTTPTSASHQQTLLSNLPCQQIAATATAETTTAPLSTIKTEPTSEPIVVVEPEGPAEDAPNEEEDEKELSASEEQFVLKAGGYMSKLLGFIKILPEFGDLSRNDQRALLKGGIMEYLVIRAAIMQTTSDACSKDREFSSIDIKGSEATKEIVTEQMKFTKRFITAARQDKVAMVLCMIMNLFSADRVNLKDRGLVARAAQRYSRMLQSYLRSIYPLKEANMLYAQLLVTLTSVRSYSEQSSQQMVTDSDLESLMREMFSTS